MARISSVLLVRKTPSFHPNVPMLRSLLPRRPASSVRATTCFSGGSETKNAAIRQGRAGSAQPSSKGAPLELGCADPARPCLIAAFLVSDPPLKQVVARTEEAGLRGSKDLSIGTFGWKLGVFRTNNTDDILAIPSPVLQGFGYFQNVGSTRRQGIETEVTLRS